MQTRRDFIATDQHAPAGEHAEGVLRLARRLEAYAEVGQLVRALPGELHTLLAGCSVALVVPEAWGAGTWFAVDGSGNSIPETPEMSQLHKALSAAMREQRGWFVLQPDLQASLAGLAQVFVGLGHPSPSMFPLNAADEWVGALCIGRPLAEPFAEAEIDVLAHVADIVSLAIDDRLVRAQLEHERTRLKLILDLNDSVVANLELRDVLRSISPSIRNVMRLDTVALILPDSESRHLRLYALDSQEGRGVVHEDMVSPLDGSISGQVFRSGKTWVGDVAELQRSSFDHRIAAVEGIQTLCMLPLIRCERVLGVLCLARRQKDAFTEVEIGFLSQLAGQIAIAIDNALAYRQITELSERLRQQKLYLEDELRSEMNFEEIVGTSAPLRAVLRQIEAVAPTNATVLIHGETGTGKELIARAVHKLSERRSKAFVKSNCAAIPTGLLESELFGHEKGAFTGAIRATDRAIRAGFGGDDFSGRGWRDTAGFAAKLLRVLQEREFERLGSSRTLRSDARLIAATNRDLSAMVREQAFRSDLFYRLNVFPIHVPALRERTRYSIPGATLCAALCTQHGKADRYDLFGNDAGAGSLSVAGQYPRDAERDRTGGHSLQRAGAAGSGKRS